MFIERSGHGPEVVLLSGWAMSRRCWGDLFPELNRYYQTVQVDLPGHESGCGSHFSFSEPQRLVEELAGQISNHSIWIGWSLGGLLAQQIAHRYPKKVARLVCIASSACFLKKENWLYGMPEETFNDFTDAFEADSSTALQRFVALQISTKTKTAEQVDKLKPFVCKNYQVEELKAALEWLRLDLREALSQFYFPALFIGGSEDQLVNVESLKASARLAPQAEYLEIAGAGHLPMISHSKQLCQSLLEHLNG